MAAGERGRLRARDHRHIEAAVREAERRTGLQFCVFLGPAGEDPRAHAHRLFADAQPAALLLVDPVQRRVEIVTAPEVLDRVPDDAAQHAIGKMTAEFAVGEIAAGIVAGLDVLADAAGSGTAAPGSVDLPDVLDG